MLRNTTNIPDRLIAIATAFAMPEGIAAPKEIVIKNKTAGLFRGQWGWYYPKPQDKVVVIVPRDVFWPVRARPRFGVREITFHDRTEFLIAVLAHELRHCYQYQAWDTPGSKWRLDHGHTAKMAREVDAIVYEEATLKRWREMVQPQAAASEGR